MKSLVTLCLVLAAFVPGLLGPSPIEAATNCAFLDLNDNGVFDAGDVQVLDSQWLAGAPFTTTEPFVVPTGCNFLFSSGFITIHGVKVTAPKITFNGVLHIAKAGGKGIRMIATGPDGFTSVGGVLKSGGVDGEFAPNKKRSVMIVAQTGGCSFKDATLEGVSPTAGTNVGVLCDGDVLFSNTKVVGALVSVRSINARIAVGTLTDPCKPEPGPPTQFLSANDPVILIAKKDLLLDGSEVNGRYRVLLVSETGNISTVNASVLNGPAPAPGGAHIAVFPSPGSVNFAVVDFEDVFGPSAGTTNIENACYTKVPQVPRKGQGSAISGTPAASCAQAGDFVAILNQIY